MYENFAVKTHAKDMIRTFDLAINSLNDYEAIEGALKQYGKTKLRDF
jgi:hypothetical protein